MCVVKLLIAYNETIVECYSQKSVKAFNSMLHT